MKSSVLKANKKSAQELSNKLLSYKTAKGNSLFTRTEIENGFEIKGKKKIEKAWTDVVVFRYRNVNGLERIDYDEQLITI